MKAFAVVAYNKEKHWWTRVVLNAKVFVHESKDCTCTYSYSYEEKVYGRKSDGDTGELSPRTIVRASKETFGILAFRLACSSKAQPGALFNLLHHYRVPT